MLNYNNIYGREKVRKQIEHIRFVACKGKLNGFSVHAKKLKAAVD